MQTARRFYPRKGLAVLAKKRSAELAVNGRGAILDAARALLAEHGGSRFSLAEVAERSGRNIALVSYYFGGKEEMLLALLDEDEKAILGPLRPLEDSKLSAEQKLERHITGVVELHARRPYLSPLIHELLRRSSKTVAQNIANRFVRPVIALQRKILEQGVAEGVFRPFDSTVFYLNVMGGIDMLISARATLQYGFGHRRDDAVLRTRFIRETMSLVMNGLCARK